MGKNRRHTRGNCWKPAIKSGCRNASRLETKVKIKLVMDNIELADEIIFGRYQDADDRWNYD
jgi:hypothetical protein